jgi:hypothetical protein
MRRGGKMTENELNKMNKLQDEILKVNRNIDLIEGLIKNGDKKTIQCFLDDKRVTKTLLEDQIFIITILGNIMEYFETKAIVLNKKFNDIQIAGDL